MVARSLVAVLDNEAAQALADVRHPKHRTVLAYVAATAGARRRSAKVVVPTAVRVEALLSRGVLRVQDVELDGRRATRAAELRGLAGGSTVDAIVAQVAEELCDDATVTVLTSDLTDLPRLTEHTSVRIQRV